jgi:hypothetical protein
VSHEFGDGHRRDDCVDGNHGWTGAREKVSTEAVETALVLEFGVGHLLPPNQPLIEEVEARETSFAVAVDDSSAIPVLFFAARVARQVEVSDLCRGAQVGKKQAWKLSV